MNELEKRIVGALEGLDEAGNAILGSAEGIPAAGNPHYTMSQRWGYMRQKGDKTACVICNLLTIMFKPFYAGVKDYDHCAEAIKDFPVDLPSEG